MSKTFTFSRKVLVPYTASQVYAVIDDVANYQHFLPHCAASGLMSRAPEGQAERVKGFMDLTFMGMRYHLESDNLHRVNERIDMNLLKGPFQSLTGVWQIQALSEQGCKVSLDMSWQYASTLLAMSIGQRFENVATLLLDAFMAETARRSGAAS